MKRTEFCAFLCQFRATFRHSSMAKLTAPTTTLLHFSTANNSDEKRW